MRYGSLVGRRGRDRPDERIRTAIDNAIKELGDLVARYYLKISGSQVYSDVELRYDPRRAGGAEFSILYDGRETFTPPQRIMSGGQLHALALAFFLARAKLEGGHWRTMVLDDVVASFGGIYRAWRMDLHKMFYFIQPGRPSTS